MDRRKIIRMITSVVISLALWVYVINVVNPTSSTVIKNVPVTLTGTDALYQNNLAIQGSGEYTVDVVVSAPRTELGSLPADNFVATADVSQLTLGQDYITITVKAPNGITVSEIRSRKIQVYVDELVKATVPVSFEYAAIDDQHETTIVAVDPVTVELSGAKALMEQLGAYVVKVDNTLLKNEQISDLVLEGEARDKSGNKLKGIECSAENISVSATIYSKKTVTLNTNYGGEVWYGVTLNKVTAPKTIDIKGPVEALSWISEVYTEYIDLYGIFKDYEAIIVPYLADNIYVCDDCKDFKLVVDVTEEANIKFDYSPWEIFVKNLKSTYAYETPEIVNGDYVTVSVQGDATILKTMSKEDVSLYVNANNVSAGENSLRILSETPIDGVKMSLSSNTVILRVR